MNYIWVAIIAAIISLSGSVLVMKIAKKYSLYPAVRERDVHSKPVARLGGVAIVVAFLLMIVGIGVFTSGNLSFGFPFAIWNISFDKRLMGIVVATVFLSGVMLIDDLRGLKAYWKFAAQIVAALILIVAGVGITYFNNPFGLAIPVDTIKYGIQIGANVYHFVLWADLILLVWVLILTNATNFIDGLDGLAGSLVAIAAVIMVSLSLKEGQPAMALLSAVLAGSIVGFLALNLPPAKLFLGDVGSNFLGLMLAVLTVVSGGKFATILLVFGLVIIDALYVVGKRIIKGKNPFTSPDQSHLHHRFLRAGFSKNGALVTICAISLAFGLSGLLLEGKAKIIMILVLVVFSLLLFALLDMMRIKRAHRA